MRNSRVSEKKSVWEHFFRERGNRRREKNPKTFLWDDAEDAAYCHFMWSAIGKQRTFYAMDTRVSMAFYISWSRDDLVKKEREEKR